MAEPEISVSVESPAWERALVDPEASVRRFALAALAAHPGFDSPVEIDVVLADDETVRAINRDWRGKDAATNVLAFARLDGGQAPRLPGQPLMLGDIILAFEICAAEAAQSGKEFDDHFAHLLVHGVLHLLGFDHENDDEAQAMEAAETAILAGLGINDPYLERRE